MLNKLVLRVVLALSLTVTGAANAAWISQDLISDQFGVVGSITINTVPSVEFGSVNEVYSWEEFIIDGWNMNEPDPIDNEFGDQFFAEFDPADLYAGIQFLHFDLSDTFALYPWEYQGSIQAGFNDGWLDIIDQNPSTPVPVFFAGDISLGEATVVPEPSALILLLTGLIAFAVRRKVS